MDYITTFDATFAALCGYYVLSMSISAVAYRRMRNAEPNPMVLYNSGRMRTLNWTVNGLWFVVLGIGAYFSLKGLATFMFACLVLAVVVGICSRITYDRRLQRELCDDLSDHMVDTLRTPSAFK